MTARPDLSKFYALRKTGDREYYAGCVDSAFDDDVSAKVDAVKSDADYLAETLFLDIRNDPFRKSVARAVASDPGKFPGLEDALREWAEFDVLEAWNKAYYSQEVF